MISFLAFFLFIVGLSACFAILFRGRFEQALPCSIFYIILVIYVSGLIGNFIPGFLIVLATAPVAFLACILKYKKAVVGEVKSNVLTPGFFYFIVALAVMMPCIFKMRINTWDEFSHWGTVIKNFWYLNDFANRANSTVKFEGYPPAASIFAWFVQKLGRNYAESKSYLAYNAFYLALMAPYFVMIKKRADWMKTIALAFCCILFPLLFWDRTYDVTYVDVMLGVILTLIFAAWLFYENEKWKYTTICLASCVLCLVKESGAGLAVIALLIIFTGEALKMKSGAKSGFKKFIPIGCMLGSILIGKYSWSIYLKISGTRTAWNTSQVSLKGIYEIFAGTAPAYRMETIKHFINVFALEPVGEGILKLSCLGWTVIAAIFAVFITIWTKKDCDRNKFVTCVWGLTGGTVIYAITLLILYCFTYSEGEALGAASFDRYMSTWLTCLVIIIILMVLYLVKAAWVWLAVPVFTGFVSYMPIYKAIVTATPIRSEEYAEWQIDARFIRLKGELERLYEGTPKVYFVHQDDSGYWRWVCHYSLTPYKVQLSEDSTPYSFDETWREDGSERWAEILEKEKFTHVFLNHVTEEFTDMFGDLFESRDDIGDAVLYEVIHEDGRIRLHKVEVF